METVDLTRNISESTYISSAGEVQIRMPTAHFHNEGGQKKARVVSPSPELCAQVMPNYKQLFQ